MEGASDICCRFASCCAFVAMIVLACRFALASLTVRKAFELEGNADAATWLADGRSSSAINAPRGSASIAAIDPGRGPIPNRWRASTASAFAERLMTMPRTTPSYGAPLTSGRGQPLKPDYIL